MRLGAAQGRGGVDAAADHVRQKIDADLGGLGERGEAQQPLLQVGRAVPVMAARLVDGLGQRGRGLLDPGQIVAVERADQRLVRTGQVSRMASCISRAGADRASSMRSAMRSGSIG